MIDKSLRKAMAERFGSLIVVRMMGGEDCLWLNMYLDGAAGQMTCDSDIGSYAYHWGRHTSKSQSWTDFCCRWLSDEKWLLRKCCGERHARLLFDKTTSENELCRMFRKANEDAPDLFLLMDDLADVICEAHGYDERSAWSTAITMTANHLGVELPDEWWNCIREEYTPWQKRFAEICREVIVPAIEEMQRREAAEQDAYEQLCQLGNPDDGSL